MDRNEAHMSSAVMALSPQQLGVALGSSSRAREVFRSLALGKNPMSDPDLSATLRRILGETVSFSAHEEVDRVGARDGTLKLLLRTSPGGAVEAVLIPHLRRTTLCVSSQIGCVRACRFCSTGRMGLHRNLATEEIVAQVHYAIGVAKRANMPPLRNLVFMGMGEPLDNWASMQAALSILTDARGFGFGPRHVTVSTVGPSPAKIAKLEECTTRIAWSLHAARDPIRRELIPTQRHHVEALADAFIELFRNRKAPLFVEMTLMKGINDEPEDARAAVRLFANFPTEVRFNLLPMNLGVEGWDPSPIARVTAFERILRDAGHFAMVRSPRGADQKAACGQLATLPSALEPIPQPG